MGEVEVKGELDEGGDHAWVRLNYKGQVLVMDPTLRRIFTKEDLEKEGLKYIKKDIHDKVINRFIAQYEELVRRNNSIFIRGI